MNPTFPVCRVLPALGISVYKHLLLRHQPELSSRIASLQVTFPCFLLGGTALILPWYFLLLRVLRSLHTFSMLPHFPLCPQNLTFSLLHTTSLQALSVLAMLVCVIVFQASYTLASLARTTTYWLVPTPLIKDPAVGSRPWWVLKSGGYSWCW